MSTVYACETCNINDLDRDGIVDHLAKVHGIDIKTEKCMRTMLSHVDGRDYFSSVYEMEWAGKAKIISSSVTERAKDDPMRMV